MYMYTHTHTHTHTQITAMSAAVSAKISAAVSCDGKNQGNTVCVSGVRYTVCEFVHVTSIGFCDEETPFLLLPLFPLLPPSLTHSPSLSIFCPPFLFLFLLYSYSHLVHVVVFNNTFFHIHTPSPLGTDKMAVINLQTKREAMFRGKRFTANTSCCMAG